MKNNLISRSDCLPYNPDLTTKARELRNNMTIAERRIWSHFLRYHNLTFHRQKIILHYIVDFYCSKPKLVIEIDGDTHFTNYGLEYDENRTRDLESLGLKVIRFTNNEVLTNIDGVCNSIEAEIALRSNKTP